MTTCMVMRLNLDCNACCRKLKRILLKMKEVETFLIEKEQDMVSVCGRFAPADVAIKIRKKMKRRVQILEIQEMGGAAFSAHDAAPTGGEEQQMMPHPPHPQEYGFMQQQA